MSTGIYVGIAVWTLAIVFVLCHFLAVKRMNEQEARRARDRAWRMRVETAERHARHANNQASVYHRAWREQRGYTDPSGPGDTVDGGDW
jgi:hypothetical protein